jgi:hypothetical protein
VALYQHRGQRFEAFVRYGMFHVNVYPQDFLRRAAQEAVKNPKAMENPLSGWKPGFTVIPTLPVRPSLLSPRVRRPMQGGWIIELPLHLALIVAAVPLLFPCLGFIRRARRRMWAQCVNCGYDLRGNTSGACPECGCATKLGKGGLHDGTVT